MPQRYACRLYPSFSIDVEKTWIYNITISGEFNTFLGSIAQKCTGNLLYFGINFEKICAGFLKANAWTKTDGRLDGKRRYSGET